MYNTNPTPPPYRGGDGYGRQTYGQSVPVLNTVLKQVYLKMTLGLLVTALISMFCAGSHAYMTYMAQNSWLFWGLFIAELALVLILSSRITRMSSGTATLLFYVFAAVNGMALSPIFLLYTSTSIAKTFFICAGTFGAMSIYGYCTSADLSRMGNILFYALIGIIIASLVNMFTHSTALGWIISIAGVLIFVGLTAWDTQQIKRMAEYAPASMAGRLSTIGALSLYLDFINLFLYLLRFFGSSRD